MSYRFRLGFRFLDSAFHGRGDGGEPEWPPSPLRAFQALVAAAAAWWRPLQFEDYAKPALEWLETLDHPKVFAPVGRSAGRPYRLYVPNNAGDLVAAALARGNADASIAKHRTEKDVRPTWLVGGQTVRFVWPLSPEQHEQGKAHIEVLRAAARSITHLGWGVDQAVGHAELLTDDPPAEPSTERWLPAGVGGNTLLRVPRAGTLAELRRKHDKFLGRLQYDSPDQVSPLSAFRVVGYRRATDPAGRQWAAFRIVSVDPDEPNPSFDAARRCRDVAAWVRSVTANVCAGWPFGDTAGFAHGHDAEGKQLKGDRADERFMYLPLPTINHKLNRVESIRRVLIAAPAGFQDRVDWIRRRLPGQVLVALNGEERGMLNVLTTSDWVLRQYTDPSRVWSTVTPVVWPGHDDRDPKKAEAILRKAFINARLPPELVRRIEELEWRPVGFRAGLDLATHYLRPEKIDGRQFHVRVRFPHPIRGPLAVGAGRYRGLGVFAADVSR
jgi:CRISPR-associated protein Csb2